MAKPPQFKIYDAANQYRASVKHPEDGAIILAVFGDGATIRTGHHPRDIIWTEGKDGVAAESYDAVAAEVWQRVDDSWGWLAEDDGTSKKVRT